MENKQKVAKETLLKIEDLKTYYFPHRGIVKAIDGISFNLYRGKVTGLVGETGCGKSTAALSIMRLVPRPGRIVEGKIVLDGTNLLELSGEEMRKTRGESMAMTFQDPATYLNPVMKVKNQIIDQILLHQDLTLPGINKKLKQLEKKKQRVEEGSRAYKKITSRIQEWKGKKRKYEELSAQIKELEEKKRKSTGDDGVLRARIEELKEKRENIANFSSFLGSFKEKVAEEKVLKLMKKVRLPHPEKVIDQYPHELSTGMRQRIMLSSMFASEPKLFIADEATTALDVTVQAQVLKMLKNIIEETNASVLYITHNLGVIAQICDYVGVMYAGRMAEFGPVDDIFFEHKHPYTTGLLKAVPSVEEEREELPSIPGSIPDLIDPPEGCRFHPRCPHAMDVCKERHPPRFYLSSEHYVECWLYEEEGDTK